MTDPRRKGKAGEREAALILGGFLGTVVTRNLGQARDGGHDLIGLRGWAVEVKRASRPRIAEWWAQAEDDRDWLGGVRGAGEGGFMKGIHCALQGRLGQDVELRRSAGGKDWCRLSVGVGEGEELTWVSVSCFEEKAAAVAGLKKGAEVYVEGRLSLNAWIGKDGQPRTGIQVAAWEALPLAQIGRKRPRARPRDEREAVPFDDPLTF